MTRTRTDRLIGELRRSPVVAFIDEGLRRNERGEPFRLLSHQRRLLEAAFAFGPDGRLPWDTIIYSCPKKSGKTTINAAVALAWAMTQEPPNELYMLANDEDQARGRVYATLGNLIRRNGLEVAVKGGSRGLTQGGFDLTTGTIVRALSSEYASAAGTNHGLTSWDELWAYTSGKMRRLWEEMTPVPTRRNSVRFITTYAGFEGESDLLHGLYRLGVGPEEYPEGRGEPVPGLEDLPVWVNREARLFCYWDHAARMPWQTADYYAAQRRQLPASQYLRFHENRWTTGRSVFIAPEAWDRCVVPASRPVLRDPALRVVVGMDAATKKDSAACVAVAFDPEAQRVRVVRHAVWYPHAADPIDLEATMEATVLAWAECYQLEAVVYDPYQLAVIARHLERAGLPMEEMPQTQDRLVAMGSSMWDLIRSGALECYPDERLREHAMNAVAVETARGFRIAKDKAARKIDLFVALAMAAHRAVGREGAGDFRLYVVDPAEAASEPMSGPAEAPAPPTAEDIMRREEQRGGEALWI